MDKSVNVMPKTLNLLKMIFYADIKMSQEYVLVGAFAFVEHANVMKKAHKN